MELHELNELAMTARAKEWADQEHANGWCWFTGEERIAPYLWNPRTGTRNTVEAMLLKAHQLGIEKTKAYDALRRELQTVDGVRFAPGMPQFLEENGCVFLNTFRSMEDAVSDIYGEVEEIEVEPFMEFINRLTMNDHDREWLLCWMAHMIQKPQERPSVHPLFRSQHGIGKNVLVEHVLNRLLAGHTSTNSLRQINSEHSESVANNLLVFVDESKAKGLNVYLQLKSILASKFATISPKYVREYHQQIYARFMFADNTEGRAFTIEQDDRRIYVMEYVIHELDKQETQEFIREFLAWWPHGWADVYCYLKQYDISAWNPFDCPMTPAKRDYLDMCTDKLENLIAKYQADTQRMTITEHSWNSFINTQGFSYEESENYRWTKLHLNRELSFRRKLEDVGFREKNASRRINGRQRRKKAWILTNHGQPSEYDLIEREDSRVLRESEEAIPEDALPESQIYTV